MNTKFNLHPARLAPCTAVAAALSLLLSSLSPANAHGGADFVAVDNTRDGGTGSLREALAYASDDEETQIVFQIPTTDSGYDRKTGIFTIQLLRPLAPVELRGTVFDGLAQSHAYNSNKNGPEIRISGAKLPPGTPGLVIKAPDCEVRGLIFSGFSGHALVLTGAKSKNCRIQGNIIEGNKGCGVVLSFGASRNYVGLAPKPPKKDADDDADGAGDIKAEESPNIIRNNGEDGVRVAGASSVGNSVRGNRLWDNRGLPLRVTTGAGGVDGGLVSPPTIKRLAGGDNAPQRAPFRIAFSWAGGQGPADVDLYWEAQTPGPKKKPLSGGTSHASLHFGDKQPVNGEFELQGYPAGDMFATVTTAEGTSAPSNMLKLDWLY